MKSIDLTLVEDKLYHAIGKAGIVMDEEVEYLIKKYKDKERNPLAKEILTDILKNGTIAQELKKPLCQDTGIALFFIEVGAKLSFNGSLEKCIDSAVERAYEDFYLRKSMVEDPLFGRKNTKTNLPPIIHWSYNNGEELKISFSAKGGGSENMSRLAMLKPADGVDGMMQFVLETVTIARSNPCPPIIVGVGVGGNFETCAILAKKALFRKLADSHKDARWADLEETLLQQINSTNIGPQGMGGDTTALAVKIEYTPCHIASLPVAVNIQCHSHRHFSLTF